MLADTLTPAVLSRNDWLQRTALSAVVPPVRLFGYERVEKALVWLQERFQPGAAGDYGNVETLRDDAPTMSTDEFAKVKYALVRFEETGIDYSRITVPTLVIYGENDLGFVRQHAAKLGAELPNVGLVEVPDAGHVSNLDDPAFFTAALREFLADGVDDPAEEGSREEGEPVASRRYPFRRDRDRCDPTTETPSSPRMAMVHVAEFTIPPEAFPFGTTLVEQPDTEIEVDQIVPTSESALPFFWVSGCDPDEFMVYAEREPEVSGTCELETIDGLSLFRAEWRPNVAVIDGLREVDVTIVESIGTADHWRFEVRAIDRDEIDRFRKVFTDAGIEIDLQRLYDLDELLEGEGAG